VGDREIANLERQGDLAPTDRLLLVHAARGERLTNKTEEHADALVMADIAAQTLLTLQADAPPGRLAAELEAGADFHYAVHQASGMVSVQLNVSVAQALIRLRAYAFGNGRPLTEVAAEVVDRTLRFDDPGGERDLVP